jgi:hypothetical protein
MRDDGGGLARDLAGGGGHLSPVTVIGDFSSVIARSRRRRGEACCPKDNPDTTLGAALDCFATLAMTVGGGDVPAWHVASCTTPLRLGSLAFAEFRRPSSKEEGPAVSQCRGFAEGSVAPGSSITHPKMHIPAK